MEKFPALGAGETVQQLMCSAFAGDPARFPSFITHGSDSQLPASPDPYLTLPALANTGIHMHKSIHKHIHIKVILKFSVLM